MLILTRREGQRILIGSDIVVTVCQLRGGQVRIGITAPPGVNVIREELKDNAARKPDTEKP